MAQRGRYYLGRVIKFGSLDTNALLRAIVSPAVVFVRSYGWTITNSVILRAPDNQIFAYGRLVKFRPEGRVTVVDPSKRLEVVQEEPNLIIASSPFVYVPEYSGLAHLHIWNQIEQRTFARRFAEVVVETYHGLFVDCDVEPITDLRRFFARLARLRAIQKIQARVNPPNPLFGPLWQPLKTYLEERNATEVRVDEKSADGEALRSELPRHVAGILEQPEYNPSGGVAFGDAALLMAADGYGRGLVEGLEDDALVVIKTWEASRTFVFDKDPEPFELYREAKEQLQGISQERDMRH